MGYTWAYDKGPGNYSVCFTMIEVLLSTPEVSLKLSSSTLSPDAFTILPRVLSAPLHPNSTLCAFPVCPQCPTIACCAGAYRFPAGFAFSISARISFFSSLPSSTSLLAQFSSRCFAFVVPGMAIMPCAATHASAICVMLHPFFEASFLISSVIARFL